jgi:hypothetical protein
MNQLEFHSNAINASDCIGNGWQLVKENYGLYLGISLLAMVLIACIPCLNIFLAGPIMGGVFYCFLKAIRGEQVNFGEMFKGFDNFIPLMVIGIIQAIPEIIGQGLRFGVNVADFGVKNGDKTFYQSDTTSILAGGMMMFAVIVGLIIFVCGIALRISLFFAIPLAMERNLDIGSAIKLSARAALANIGGLIVLFLLEFLVALAGMVAFCIGIFFVIPIIYAANAFAYRQVFPDVGQNVPNVPPSPDAYGGNYGYGR